MILLVDLYGRSAFLKIYVQVILEKMPGRIIGNKKVRENFAVNTSIIPILHPVLLI
jgi:hypothetical protein